MTISRDPGIQLNHENQTTPKPHQRAAGCNEVGHARTYGWRGQVEWLAFGYAWMRFIRRCEPLKGDTAARYLHLDEKGSFQLSETGIRGFWHLVGRNQLASSSGFKSFDFYTHIYIYTHTYTVKFHISYTLNERCLQFPFTSHLLVNSCIQVDNLAEHFTEHGAHVAPPQAVASETRVFFYAMQLTLLGTNRTPPKALLNMFFLSQGGIC